MREENKQIIPLWGPYSKKYMGISRIMRESGIPGARWDLVVYPTYANSAVSVPNVTVPSDYHPWNCDDEGKYFRYRYELLWKDMLYADVDFFCIEDETWGIRVSYQNNTERNQNCLLNFFVAEEYPQNSIYAVRCPEKSEVWNALDYDRLVYAKERPWEHLNHDAMKKGEVFIEDFTDGNGLGCSYYIMLVKHWNLKWFGGECGDTVSYKKVLKKPYENAVLNIRYKTMQDKESVSFSSRFGRILFEPSSTPAMCRIPLGKLESGDFQFTMEADGMAGNGVFLDFFAITEAEEAENVYAEKEIRNTIPKIEHQKESIKYQYNYGELPIYFTIKNKRVRNRDLYSGCLEDALITRMTNSDHTYDNLTKSFSGAFMDKHSDEGFYHANVVEAIFLPAKSRHVEYAYVSTCEEKKYTERELEKIWESRVRSSRKKDDLNNKEGNQYEFSTRLMKTAIFSNIVYPIYRHGEYISHYTLGKRWDSLYTWDSGFIGIGMLEYSEKLAEYIMDTYLSEPDNQDFAFVAHGSLVPTQFYLFYEILQRADEKRREELKKYYPMFLRYYRYMAGKTEGSATNRLGSGLLTVYDYFYNASGMDDYPPQKEIHHRKLEQIASPVCSNVHFIRIAKIMKRIAKLFGMNTDITEFTEDLNRVKDAFLSSAWDEESGYFGYILHHPDGRCEIFRTESGENFNKGIDGVTPLIAGICSEHQEKLLLQHLKSDRELWSCVGISTVDMSASYFYDNGYWNGSVWYPYQYLIWKSMLDIGQNTFAYKIADRALSSWKQETEFSYNTFEMIQIETERGGWFHQFSGLSSPIVTWYHAYYKRGCITTGYETWVESQRFNEDYTEAVITYEFNDKKKNTMIIVMDSDYEYQIFVNGKLMEHEEHVKGALEIRLYEEKGKIKVIKNEEIL